ncbi:flippase [Shewanella frigidimarina]|nr:flippase [Shewanella frigidimarina]
MTSNRKSISNAIWLLSEQMIVLVITFLISVFLARHLGPALFGEYNFILAFVALIAPFTSLGLNAIVTRELVNGVDQVRVLSNSVIMRFSGGVIGALIAIVLLIVFREHIAVDYEWLIIFALVNIMSAFYVIDFYFHAEETSQYLVAVRLVILIVTSIAKVIGLIYQFDLSFFLWVAFANIMLKGIGYMLMYFYYNERLLNKVSSRAVIWDKDYSLSLLNQSKWLILSGFMYAICLKIDQLMLGQMVNASAVGTYAVAAKLSEVWYFLPLAITTSFFPKLLKVRSDKDNYYQQIQILCHYLLAMAVIIAVLVSLISPWLLPFAFGASYLPAVSILNIHIWGACFIFMRTLLSKWFIAEGLLKFSLFTHGIAAVINVILNLFLIPKFGGIGAAYATLISYGLTSYALLWCNPQTLIMARIMTKSLLFPWFLGKDLVSYLRKPPH